MSPRRVLFVPDIQIPDHDASALKIVMDFKRDFKPHDVCQLGDLMNADQVSSYPNEADIELEEEFALARSVLRDLGVTHFLMGNHEERLTRVGLVSRKIRSMLNPVKNLHLEQMGIKWRPYHKTDGVMRWGKLTALHGFFCNEYAAKKHADAYGCCIFGHTHRYQIHQPKHAFSSHTGYNIGCLCKLDLPYRTSDPPDGWAQAFAFGYFFRSGHFSLYPVRLIGDQICIEGKVYRRHSRLYEPKGVR